MLNALLRAAATATAARSLRAAVDQAIVRALLALGAGAALAVSAACLSIAAFVFLESQLDPASAAAIVGGAWGLAGLACVVALRR